MKKQENQEQKGRVVAFLTREEIDFIDKLSKDALFSTGHKLSRTDVIQALIDAVKGGEITGDGIHSKTELEDRLLDLMSKEASHLRDELKREISENEDESK